MGSNGSEEVFQIFSLHITPRIDGEFCEYLYERMLAFGGNDRSSSTVQSHAILDEKTL